MKLTPAERAILINQYSILAHLEGKPDAYKEEITAIRGGYDEDFAELVGYLEGETISEENRKLVRDVLWLYYLMKLTVNKAALEANTIKSDHTGRRKLEAVEPKFPGFDGNDGTGCLGFAEYLIFERDQFPEHRHQLNSHGGQPDYERMLDVWGTWGRPSTLTDGQVKELLAIR